MKTIETKVYEFAELDEAAKERAREWWREVAEFDADFVIEDFKEIAGKLGLTVDNVYWSGFCSQGDGASFTGEWRAESCPTGEKLAEVLADYPDTKGNQWIHSLAKSLADLATEYPSLVVDIRCSGRYSHSGTMTTDSDWSEDSDAELPDVTDTFRWVADDLFFSLRREYEWTMDDEQVDEAITANGYTFTETGKRFG